MILVIDNYDSFVHNLARYLRQLGQPTHVVRNDQTTIAEIDQSKPAAIVISPGPCSPNEAGISLDVVDQFTGKIPILGVCLGHQAIVQALGGKILRSGGPMHGRSSQVTHGGTPLFANIPSPFQVGRYHSLIADKLTLPPSLSATAQAADGTIMAVEHDNHPVVGLQFHPESILTEHGYQLLENFLKLSHIDTPADINAQALKP